MRDILLKGVFCVEVYFLVAACCRIVGAFLPQRGRRRAGIRIPKMRNRTFFIGCCIALFALGGWSCTHDYFEDQTNYRVFVPEVQQNSVNDCRVLVYDQSGALAGERYAAAPFDGDTRTAAGLFAFRLPPGRYTVYCYTNTEGIRFDSPQSLASASFRQIRIEEAEEPEAHSQPSDVFWEKLNPEIFFYRLTVDTVQLERYVGRVTVRFKNFPHPVSGIARSRLFASEIATVQPLSTDTVTARNTETDCMLSFDPLSPQSQDFEVEHLYFPSLANGVPMDLRFRFLGAGGEFVAEMPVEARDKTTGQPLRLGPGQRLIIEVDGYTVIRTALVGWDEDIESSDTDIQ